MRKEAKNHLESRMQGNLHVRFGVGAGVQTPGLHHNETAKSGQTDSADREIEELQQRYDALRNETTVLRGQLRDCEAMLASAQRERAQTAEALVQTRSENAQETADLRKQLERDREESGARERALTRHVERNLLGDVGCSIEHIVKSFRHWQAHRDAPEPEVHLSAMLESLLNRLSSKGVPLER